MDHQLGRVSCNTSGIRADSHTKIKSILGQRTYIKVVGSKSDFEPQKQVSLILRLSHSLSSKCDRQSMSDNYSCGSKSDFRPKTLTYCVDGQLPSTKQIVQATGDLQAI